MRLGRLPEAWIAPPAIRELRELVRYRAKLVQLRSGLKAQVHAVMAKEGVLPPVADLFGPAGQRQLDAMALGAGYTIRVESLRDLIEVYDREIVHARAARSTLGCAATAAIGRSRPSTGSDRRSRRSSSPRSATCTRFPTARAPVLVGRADPAASRVRHHGRTGHITKQGSGWCAGR